MFDSCLKLQLSTHAPPAQNSMSPYFPIMSKHSPVLQKQSIKSQDLACQNPSSPLCILKVIIQHLILASQNAVNEGSCSGEYCFIPLFPLFPDLFQCHKLAPSLFPYNTSLYNAICTSQLLQTCRVSFLWLKALSANTNIPCCYFQKPDDFFQLQVYI